MTSKVSVLAFNSECLRWRRAEHKCERLGQRLMNAFSVGGPDPEVFYMRDHDKASALFFERYVDGEA